jgi:hypothetical protein
VKPSWLLLFVWFILFIWLNQTNQINQTDHKRQEPDAVDSWRAEPSENGMLPFLTTMITLAFLFAHAINSISLWREEGHVLHWPYKSHFLSSAEDS